MVGPVTLTRKELVSEVSRSSISVADAQADSRLAGVDVGAADLNGDGKISGKREADRLFEEIDKFDRNGSDNSLALFDKSGASTNVTSKVAAVGDLAKSAKLQRQARAADPGNDDVLFVGLRDENKSEAKALAKSGRRKFEVTWVGSDSSTVKGADAKDYDLSSRAGIDGFTASLGLPAAQSKSIGDAIEGAPVSGRDELAGMAKVWAKAEKGGEIPSRLVISGHHVQDFFGSNGSLYPSDVLALAKAMPKAAAKVEDIHLAGCYTLGRSSLRDYRDAFPNLETLWGYGHTAPLAGGGAEDHEARWDEATRGRVGILGREAARSTRHAADVIVWSRTGGYDDGAKAPSLDDLRAEESWRSMYYDSAFKGDVKVDPHEGNLRDYYNSVRDLMEADGLPDADRAKLQDKTERTIRLLYFSDIEKGWARANGDVLAKAYTSAGITAPDFTKMDRKASLAAIDTFLKATDKSSDPAVLEARKQMIALRDLDPKLLDKKWIP